MDIREAQARATIAAALIMSRAVEIPSLPGAGERLPDDVGSRLRALTDYVYRLVTADDLEDPERGSQGHAPFTSG